MKFSNGFWLLVFQILLFAVFIVSSGVGSRIIAYNDSRKSELGADVIAAASLICLTLIKLYTLKQKKN